MAKLLLIEDDADLSELMVAVLESENYAVQLAERATKALEVLREVSFDLVIADVMMPGMMFYDFEKLYLKAGFQTPIMICTGLDESEVKTFGSYPILTKPFDDVALLKMVKESIERGIK